MKKMVIVGAGIAGLVCGIYAQRSGFETEILEKQSVPGGECTGWDRGGYSFDGCIHWLTGSNPGTQMHRLWRTTGALDDTVGIVNHTVLLKYEGDGKAVRLYTNADALEEHLTELSPADGEQIAALCDAIRSMKDFEMPLDKPMDWMTAEEGAEFAAKNADAMKLLAPYTQTTMQAYADEFCEPAIGRALLCVVPKEYQASALVATLACLNKGDGGYPVGGSRALAKRMEQRYLSLGGKVTYRAQAGRVLIENGRAVGVTLTDGRVVMGDYVVSCADGYHTLYRLLNNAYTPAVYKALFENPQGHYLRTCAIVFMGVNADIGDETRCVCMRREGSVSFGGAETDVATLLLYRFDETTAPAGKTVAACSYDADYDYWHALDRDAYRAEKRKLENDAKRQLIRRFPDAEGKIECTDVVTPETYARFCNAWRGAWMSWGSAEGAPPYFPGLLPGLSNFAMAGMWTLPPGGLPSAAAAGRFAAHRICAAEGIAFQGDD